MTDWTKSTHAIDARGNEVRVKIVRKNENGKNQLFSILDAAYLKDDEHIKGPISLGFYDGVLIGYKDFKLIPPQEEWQYIEADKRVDDGDYRGLAAALIAKYEEEPLEPAGVAYNSISGIHWDNLDNDVKDFYRQIYEAGKKDAG